MSSEYRLRSNDISWISALTLISHKGEDDAKVILENIFPPKVVYYKIESAYNRGYIDFGEITRLGVEYLDKLQALKTEYTILKAVNDSPLWKDEIEDYDVESLDYIYYHARFFEMDDNVDFIRLNKKGKGYLKHLTKMLSMNTHLQCKDLKYDKLKSLGVTKAELYMLFPHKIVDLKLKRVRDIMEKV